MPQNIRCQVSSNLFKKEINKLLGAPAPARYFLYGTKTKNTLHIRLRTDTLPLNAYLYQIQKSLTPGCPCGAHIENSKHFILNCPLYDTHRHALINILLVHNIDARHIQQTQLLNIIATGTTLQAEQGRAVAGAVQNFIQSALNTRSRVVSGGGGGGASPSGA